MSLKSQKQSRIEQQQVDSLQIDRWSITIIISVIAVLITLLLITKHKVKYSWIPTGVSVIPFAITAMSSARIRRNKYEGLMYYKGEKNCGLTKIPIKNIDGVVVKDKVFKAPNGTDIKIDKQGNVSYVGFGSKLISYLDGAGYLTEAPDECWK